MIRMPRRSVTRFFIPLIDVLTLLFCIYLLLPLVEAPEDSGDFSASAGTNAREPTLAVLEELRRERDRLQQEKEEWERLRQTVRDLRQERIETLRQRLFIRVLEIDADTGKLFVATPEGREEIATQAQAQALIARDRQTAPERELYYLFLFPRRLTGYPQEGQVQRYRNWFEGVAYGFDNPRSGA